MFNQLKSNKAGGSDNIMPELIKHGERTLKQRIYNLITTIWEKEQLPSQWNKRVICPLYKKGDRLDCMNYRPITLLNVAYKIFTIILNQRLVGIIETEVGDYQSGFRPNRFTVDNTFMVRQIIEKCYEYNIDIYNIFIGYTYTFDSTKWNKILDAITQNKIPSKLIRLIKLTLVNTTAKVKVSNA
jgi:sorting nexin-29